MGNTRTCRVYEIDFPAYSSGVATSIIIGGIISIFIHSSLSHDLFILRSIAVTLSKHEHMNTSLAQLLMLSTELIRFLTTYREARIPWFWNESPAYWHHIATTWSSDTGQWKIYLDGSLVSIMRDVVSHITIPAGEQLFLSKRHLYSVLAYIKILQMFLAVFM